MAGPDHIVSYFAGSIDHFYRVDYRSVVCVYIILTQGDQLVSRAGFNLPLEDEQ